MQARPDSELSHHHHHISQGRWHSPASKGERLTKEAKTGRKRVAVATLLVHSVKTAMARDRMMEMAQGGTLCRGLIWSPSHLDSPEA